MSDLAALVEPLKREVALPDQFATVFPGVTDQGLSGSLADAFGEAQLDGYLRGQTLTIDTDAGTWTVDPDLSAAGAALVTIYAGIRIIRAQLRNLKTSTSFKAGPTEAAFAQSATLLRQELVDMQNRRDELIRRASNSFGVVVFDSYYARQAAELCGGFYPWEC